MTDPNAFSPGAPYGRRAGDYRYRSQALTGPVIVWALYLGGFVTGGLTTFIGLIAAYAMKGGATEAAWSHYIFAIRTIWVGLAWVVIGSLLFAVGLPLTLVLIGFVFLKAAVLIWGVLGLWFVARSVMAIVYAIKDEPYPRPRSWLI